MTADAAGPATLKRDCLTLNMRIVGYVLLMIVAGPGVSFSDAAEPDPLPWSHGDAIELARNGEFDEALRILRALREADPANSRLLHEETVVLGWAGQDQLALENGKLIHLESAPGYVVSAVARSARNLGEFEMAAHWYSTLLDRDLANLDARLGLAMTHADSADPEKAWTVIAEAPDDQKNAVQLRLTEAYLYEREGRFMEALASYQRVLEMEPENREALRGTTLVLRMALLPRQALALATEHAGILSEEEIVQLEADVAALQIRYGVQSSYPAPRRHEGTDQALSQIDSLLARSDLDHTVRLRLRYDRIVALADRLLMADAIAAFEALATDPEEVPAYVLAGVGTAWLYEHQPERARHALALAVAKQPGNIEYKFQLFFAYTDLQEPERALDLAETLLASLPPTNQVPGSPVVKGNAYYLRAAVMVGLARAFADQLADSQEYLEQLLEKVPHNTNVRQELASVYRWRGWLDRSLSEYAQVLAVEPDLMSARIGNAHAHLDNRDYTPVEQEVRALREHYGDERAVKNLTERWQAHNRHELSVDAEVGESTGPTFGEDQYRVDAAWFSKPIARRYRALINTHDASAGFPEGDARRRRVGAGVEYRYRRWLASVRLSADRSGGELGFRGSFDYRVSDLFSFGGILETESNATPLRGQRVGVSSDLLGLNAVYARHESSALRAALTYQDFSDGNTGSSIFLGAEQRLFSRPNYKLTMTAEVSLEDRDRDDVAYFSPQSGFSWRAGLRNDWLMFRRYDLRLTHRITGTFGQYDQSGFSASDIWSLDYEFRADINKRWSTHIGLSRRSNVYDGGREYASFLVAGFAARF